MTEFPPSATLELADRLKIASFTAPAHDYPGYPRSRYRHPLEDEINSSLTIPDGLWNYDTTESTLPTPEEQAILQMQGYSLDLLGRPLHPWILDLLQGPGVIANKGAYWRWGPNYTVDPVVVTGEAAPRVLLIQRGDTGAWAIPGGFLDILADGQIESVVSAGLRELQEETGLRLSPDAVPELLYTGVTADARSTAHAWAETTVLVWHIPYAPQVTAGDDAVVASWFPLYTLPETMHGSHKVFLEEVAARFSGAS